MTGRERSVKEMRRRTACEFNNAKGLFQAELPLEGNENITLEL